MTYKRRFVEDTDSIVERAEKKLWRRKLSCGHTRDTNIAFFCEKYDKPKKNDECFCRECFKEVIVVGVEEVKWKTKNQQKKN